jgi:outer membrane protein assembly factor BamD (BamD/ComL family)
LKLKDQIAIFCLAGWLLLAGGLSGCGRVHLDASLSPEEQWELAKRAFEYENYLDAVDILNVFTLNYSGSALIDSAQFLLGECHFALHEYILAESEYQRLVQNLPQSPLVDDARLKMVLCNLYLSPAYPRDQKYTEKTSQVARDFLQDYASTDLTLQLAPQKSGWRILGEIFTLGMLPNPRADIQERPLFDTQVVYPKRDQGFGRWLLNILTLGLYPSPVPDLILPPSQKVSGDWAVARALEGCQARLSMKDFKSAELYFRQDKYPSAVIYCDRVLGIYASTPSAGPALRLKADSMYAMGKYGEAAPLYEKYLKDYGAQDREHVQRRWQSSLQHLQQSAAAPPGGSDR